MLFFLEKRVGEMTQIRKKRFPVNLETLGARLVTFLHFDVKKKISFKQSV